MCPNVEGLRDGGGGVVFPAQTKYRFVEESSLTRPCRQKGTRTQIPQSIMPLPFLGSKTISARVCATLAGMFQGVNPSQGGGLD